MKGVETELNGLLQEQGHLTEQQKKNKTELAELKKVCMTPNSFKCGRGCEVQYRFPCT